MMSKKIKVNKIANILKKDIVTKVTSHKYKDAV